MLPRKRNPLRPSRVPNAVTCSRREAISGLHQRIRGGQWLGGLLFEDVYSGPRLGQRGGYLNSKAVLFAPLHCGNIRGDLERGGRLDGLLITNRGSFEDVPSCNDGGGEPPEYARGGFDLDVASRVNILESFYYVADWQTENLHRFKSFMLDSGAFTFAYGSKEKVDLDSYLTRYIDYIKRNDVNLFFELDVDKLVGYQRVLEYREHLERETGKRSIPVWHISRGKDEWLKMVREYDYVALGGLAAKEFSNQERYIPWFTRTAHENGCKVHGLGYTKLPHLPYMGFDSVDSSAWLVGNRGGFLYRYNHDGCRMAKVQAPKGKRLDARMAARHNFMQWVELAEYLED